MDGANRDGSRADSGEMTFFALSRRVKEFCLTQAPTIASRSTDEVCEALPSAIERDPIG
jgi:hypothetical protein